MNRDIALKQLKFLKSKGREMRLAADGWRNDWHQEGRPSSEHPKKRNKDNTDSAGDWRTLVAILLSARTRDEVTILVCEKMFEKYPTPQDFVRLQISDIRRLIRSINFYNNKSKYIYNMTKDLMKRFGGKVPNKVEDLITLPGVGRKTANVFLAQKGGANIGVDTHVNYISNYLGWVDSKKPEIVEKELEELFPKSKWKDVNNTLVGFGKTYTSKREKDALLDVASKLASR